MQAVMTSVTPTSIIEASSLTVTNSVTFRILFSRSSRACSSCIRADTASRLSRRCLAVLNLDPLEVRRASVSLICFCTSSSLTSVCTGAGFGAPFGPLFLLLSRNDPRPEPPPEPGPPAAERPSVRGAPGAGFWFRSTLSLVMRLRFSRRPKSPFFSSRFTSILPSTFGPDKRFSSELGRNRFVWSAATRSSYVWVCAAASAVRVETTGTGCAAGFATAAGLDAGAGATALGAALAAGAAAVASGAAVDTGAAAEGATDVAAGALGAAAAGCETGSLLTAGAGAGFCSAAGATAGTLFSEGSSGFFASAGAAAGFLPDRSILPNIFGVLIAATSSFTLITPLLMITSFLKSASSSAGAPSLRLPRDTASSF